MEGLNEKEIAAVERETRREHEELLKERGVGKDTLFIMNEATRNVCRKLYRALNDKLAKAAEREIVIPTEEEKRILRELKKTGTIRRMTPEETKAEITPWWIPVEEMLPNEKETTDLKRRRWFLVVAEVTEEGPVKGYRSIEKARYFGGGRWNIPEVTMGYIITHWMEMPELPEG